LHIAAYRPVVTDTPKTDRATVAERAARAGGDLALESFRAGIAVDRKSSKTDVVTQADRDSQEEVSAVVAESHPEEPIVGEEGDELKEVPESGPAWVIDPIDGTNNYVRGIRTWVTSVAATSEGEPIAAANAMPALGDTYLADRERATLNGEPIAVSDRTDPEAATVAVTAWPGTSRPETYTRLTNALVQEFGDLRRFGCAQATLSFVASGALDAVVTNTDPNPWDTLAGVCLIRRAGGRVSKIDGEHWDGEGGLLASNGESEIHEAALDVAGVLRD
jgi:myo-inositol-1(or 4)-monophosphatase